MDFFTQELERDALKSYHYKLANGGFDRDDDADDSQQFAFMGGEKENRKQPEKKRRHMGSNFMSFIQKAPGFDRKKQQFHKMTEE